MSAGRSYALVALTLAELRAVVEALRTAPSSAAVPEADFLAALSKAKRYLELREGRRSGPRTLELDAEPAVHCPQGGLCLADDCLAAGACQGF